MHDKIYWVYILHCENNAYYTGYTTDLVRRLQEHVTGSPKCRYTRSFKPLHLAQCWKVLGNQSLAMRLEKYIKKKPKSEKTKLIQDPESVSILFSCQPALADFKKNSSSSRSQEFP